MNDPTTISHPSTVSPESSASTGFAFTDPGCRSDIRLGALLVLMSVFLWLWWGPTTSSRIYLVGAPLLLWGIPWQAIEARRFGRPGFPWKLGIALTIAGVVMGWGGLIGLPDLRYREGISDTLWTQPVGPLLLIIGVWILAWWPVAKRRVSQESQ